MFYAGCWGIGHATMLLFVAGPLVALRLELPSRVTTALELGASAMLIFLGARALDASPARAAVGTVLERGRRPFTIGVVHGLAGSGALAAVLALGAPTVAAGLASVALYAFGTVIGMVALAAAFGSALAHVVTAPKSARLLTRVAGVASIVVGVVWIARTLAEL
jgi:threonine/homoserine/homoserine lactone efflux protein